MTNGLRYRKCATYHISSPQIWNSYTFLDKGKAMAKMDELLSNGQAIQINLEYEPNGQIIEDFDEETQSSPTLKAMAEGI